MADPTNRDRASLGDQAEARTTAPAALNENTHRHDHQDHDHGHEHHDHDDEDGHDHEHPFAWQEALRIGFVAVAAALVWFRVWEPITTVSVIGVFGLLVGGWPILKEAFENVLQRRMTMELSMTIAIVAAAAIGEFFTALVITLFVLVAEALEGLTVGRGRRAIRDLLEFLPREVSVRRTGAIQTISSEELSIGDAILVAPGGRIPVDGAVLAGHSFVDESRITGESMPVEKGEGAAVFAGSINQSEALEVRAERIGKDTSYGKIIEAVERAERSRAPVQRLADRMAGYLVYFALGSAVLTYLITQNIYSTISVVIVAGACGIAAGTPLAILGGIGRSARLGAIIKGGVHLETLGKVDTVVLDKTGTLTFGRPEVQAVVAVAGARSEDLLDAAASAELRSEHPLGKAIIAHARQQGRIIAEPEHFAYTPGRGIDAKVAGSQVLVGNRNWMQDNSILIPSALSHGVEAASEVYVARDGALLGAIAVADTVRPEAKRAIEALNALGIRTILLTGDALPVANAVGHSLGIEEIEAGLLPEDKLARIQALVRQKRVVAMVGDGRRWCQRRPRTGRSECGHRDGLGDRCGPGERRRRPARQRSRSPCGDAEGRPTHAPDHLAEFRGHPGHRRPRDRNGRCRSAKSAARGLHPRHVRARLYPELREAPATQGDAERGPDRAPTVHGWAGSDSSAMSSDSPCIDVCRFEGRTGWCIGCGRTVPEIRAWRKMQPRARQMVSKDLKRRVEWLKDQGKGHTPSNSAAPLRGSLS